MNSSNIVAIVLVLVKMYLLAPPGLNASATPAAQSSGSAKRSRFCVRGVLMHSSNII